MVQKDDVLPRATEPPFLSAQIFKHYVLRRPYRGRSLNLHISVLMFRVKTVFFFLILAKLRESPQCVLF